MNRRPLSLTIIGWFVIVTSIFSLVSALTIGSNPQAAAFIDESPLSLGVHQLVGLIGAIITLACGYGILKGLNWARYLYVGAALAGLLFNLLTVPMVSIIVLGLLFIAVFGFFLFRPAANDWFNRTPANAEH